MKYLALLLLSISVFAQQGQYQRSAGLQTVDSVIWGNCRTVNCYGALTGHVDQLSVSPDGNLILGINSSLHTLYKFSKTTKSWTQIPGSNYQQVANGGNNDVYVLTTTPCGWGYAFGSVNIATGVVSLYPNSTNPWCWHQISAARNYIWALGAPNGAGYDMYYFDAKAGTPSYKQQPGGCSKMASAGAKGAYCFNSGNIVYSVNATTGVNTNLGITAVDIAFGRGSNVYILDNTAAHAPRKYTGSGWRAFYSSQSVPWSGISVGPQGNVFLIKNQTGNNFYYLKDIVLDLTSTTQGTYNCNLLPNGCPIGSAHTVTATAKFGGIGGLNGTAGVTGTGGPSSPTTYFSVRASEFATNCDLIFGNPSAPECQPAQVNTGDCSKMGILAVAGKAINGFQHEVCTARYAKGGKISTAPGLVDECVYLGAQHCTASTYPPDSGVYVQISDECFIADAFYWGWDTFGICSRAVFVDGTHSSWYVLLGGALPDGSDPGPYSCTHNP